jgi:ABC-type Fe3+-hydroxamate transport system substrate-binding protein
MKRIAAAILGLMVLAGGCAREETGSATQAGTKARFEGARGKRVVSMSPSATLVARQIGGIDSFVGVSTFDAMSLPDDMKDLPIVGDYEKVNIELLTRLKPTSVIVFSSPEKLPAPVRQMADKKTFELASLPFDTLDDLWKNTTALGRLTGREIDADNEIAKAQLKIAQVEKKVSGVKEKPRVLFVVSTTGRIAVEGSDIFFDDVITKAGGVNAGAEVGKRWVELNKEACIRLKPDVVIVSAPGEPAAQANDERIEKWKNLDIPAAKTGRIYLWTDPDGQMLSLKVADMVQTMAETLHPNLMKPTPFDDLPAAQEAR